MAQAADRQGMLLQALRDAGCSDEAIRACVRLAAGRDMPGLCRLLAAHRKTLLEAVRGKQRQLDCLDFLLFQLNHSGGDFL